MRLAAWLLSGQCDGPTDRIGEAFMFDDYITLGRSGLRVSRMALGSFNFGGGHDWELAPADAHAIIDRYRALGGNFIDSANIYGSGEAEGIIGDHFAASSARDSMVIATKFTNNVQPGDPNGGGAHRKSIVRACERSLRRLRTDYIDLFWMHMWDKATPIEESLRALDDLVSQGKVLHIGFSNVPAWKVTEAHCLAAFRGYSPVVALQLQYSLLERNIGAELVPMAQAYGIGICPWSPLKSGALSARFTRETIAGASGGRAALARRSLDERGFAIVDTVIGIARIRGSTSAQVALAWLRQQPCVASILLGADSMAELEENGATSGITLDAEELATLDAVSRPALRYPLDLVNRGPGAIYGGTRINGVAADGGGHIR
jgi:aryl-alcohol dehydrogenase-like predicted oxidoreductase